MIDEEMQRLVHLGILKKDMSPYSSPIMLIARENSSWKRIITDLRFLNSTLQRLDMAFPLSRDAFAILGSSKCECLSLLDLRDVYHTIKLSESFTPYCGKSPYLVLLVIYVKECQWEDMQAQLYSSLTEMPFSVVYIYFTYQSI